MLLPCLAGASTATYTATAVPTVANTITPGPGVSSSSIVNQVMDQFGRSQSPLFAIGAYGVTDTAIVIPGAVGYKIQVLWAEFTAYSALSIVSLDSPTVTITGPVAMAGGSTNIGAIGYLIPPIETPFPPTAWGEPVRFRTHRGTGPIRWLGFTICYIKL